MTPAPGKKIRILWVEDHALLRDAVGRLFSESREFLLHHVTDDVRDAENILQKETIDLVLLDLMLRQENTLSKIAQWHKRFPTVQILVLSGTNNPGVVQKALKSGAIGFVSKLDPAADLFTALRKASRQVPFISRSVQNTSRNGELAQLSRREEEILREIAEGRPVRKIAERLGISTKTVERHKENLKTKLNLDNASGLLREALRLFPSDIASL